MTKDSVKKSIRFFNDREVRAVWDDENDRWLFSAIDIVRAINDEPDYVKGGNYWRWLKRKMSNRGLQLVSGTHEFKFQAPDGKMRFSFRQLNFNRQFYLEYPKVNALRSQFNWTQYRALIQIPDKEKRGRESKTRDRIEERR